MVHRINEARADQAIFGQTSVAVAETAKLRRQLPIDFYFTEGANESEKERLYPDLPFPRPPDLLQKGKKGEPLPSDFRKDARDLLQRGNEAEPL